MARLTVLGTGSGGNCFYVGSNGRGILVDAGFRAKEIEARMRSLDLEPRAVDGIFLTHEHGDHVRGAANFATRHALPVHSTRATYRSVPSLRRRKVRFQAIEPGQAFTTGPFTVTPFSIPHDAQDPVGYLVDVDGVRIGITTDLGHVTPVVRTAWCTADVLVVESNHDIDMLRLGPYPASLKERVLSLRGHLSNDALAGFFAERLLRPLNRVVLAHLSKVNNHPNLALATARRALGGAAVHLSVAAQDEPTPIVEL
ncbi:MAG: MBL fold metallo-hydrolase [Acidobacteriota bacterium]